MFYLLFHLVLVHEAFSSFPSHIFGVSSNDTNNTLAGIILMQSLEDRKSTRLNSSHSGESRMPSSA